MGKILKTFHRWFTLFHGFFPTPLPRGKEDFNKFVNSICDTYKIPNNLSHQRAIATLILHAGPLDHKMSKRFFVRSIKAAQAREVAYWQIEEIKKQEQAEKEVTTGKEESLHGVSKRAVSK